jgi:glyoxylase-like metal-dependent hydrolase (beta-lactamase superfamily II)
MSAASRPPSRHGYTRGLHEIGDGTFAYLQPDGGWGWSNAGLIVGSGESMLVDTLFDLRLTREMLGAMDPLTAANPITRAANTHGNGDHYFGNQLLPDGIPIFATAPAIDEMRAVPPSAADQLFNGLDLGPEFDVFADRTMRRFDFSNIEHRPANEPFSGRHELQVANRHVSLIEVGPAHTSGDAIVWLPDARTIFSGDVLFIKGTPIMWAGPVSNWLRACDLILALDAVTIVPGHGPVTDADGVRAVAHYLGYVHDQARTRFAAGMGVDEAADDIDLSEFSDWGDPERIAVNVFTIYRELDPSIPEVSVPELFAKMARWSARH